MTQHTEGGGREGERARERESQRDHRLQARPVLTGKSMQWHVFI